MRLAPHEIRSRKREWMGGGGALFTTAASFFIDRHDMSCCYLINFGMDSRLEELKRNAGVFKLVFFFFVKLNFLI